MSFAPEKLYFRHAPVFLLALLLALTGLNLQAQTRRPAKPNPKEKQTAKNIKDEKKDLAAEKNKKPTRVELARQAEIERREDERQREAEEREADRKQAVLAEKRRREQAAREARERYLAFERGLRTETLQNIANDDTTGEDLEVRRAAISALGNHAGTVVVIEPQTGKVLSIVNQDWAIRKGFKPCSTIKLVTGVAGLNENAIERDGRISARSFPMDLSDALAHSNNSYFQKVGADLGSNRMISYARALGLGEPTGINAPNESAGRLPYGNNNPRIYSHGDDFEVTPLQLAVMVSTLTNGGKKIVPQIPRSSYEKANFRGAMRGEVNLPKDKMQGVLPGMIGAVNYGTARRSGSTQFNAAGKTGSCTGQGSWLGLFASVAPVINPKLAVVVVTRGQAERGKYASAIAGKVYQALASRMRETGVTNNRVELIARVPQELKPQPKVDAKTSALVDNDEGEDSDEGDVNNAKINAENAKRGNPKKGGDDLKQTVDSNNSGAALKSPVNKTDKSSNPFKPVVINVNKVPQEDQPLSRPRIVRTN
jgi:hypothetical protein